MTSSRPTYDVVVVGARAAGAATAMLLARAGARVLVVDRGRYGADTLSTHALMRGAVLQLERWGLLPDIVRAGTPPVRQATFHYESTRMVLDIKPDHGVDALYAPRRTVLDAILVDAARAAGAQVHYGVAVRRLRRDEIGRVVGIEGSDRLGRSFIADGRLVVGADGLRSVVAEQAGAPVIRLARAASAFLYGYWADVPTGGYEWAFRSGASAGLIPTNDGATCVFVGTSADAFASSGRAAFGPLLEAASPDLAERVSTGRPLGTLRVFPGRPGYVRQAWGSGWALVGDAGYWKDPLTSHGLTDALRDAELLARAVLAGSSPEALADYQATRDRLSARLFAVSDRIATHAWTDDEIQRLLRELADSTTDEVTELASLPPMDGSLRSPHDLVPVGI